MKQPPPMTPLDELTSSPELRMMKLFLTFLPSASQHTLAVFIKLLEFRQALFLSLPDESQLTSQNLAESAGRFPDQLLQNLRPYLTTQELQIFETFNTAQKMFSMMELFHTVADPGSPVSSSEPGASGTSSGSGSTTSESDSAVPGSMSDFLMNLLSPEQRDNFKFYNDLFSSAASSSGSGHAEQSSSDTHSHPDEPEISKKGELTYGKLDESSRNETDRSCQAGADQTGRQSDAGKNRT